LHYEALSDEEEKLTENTVDSLLQDSIESQTAESPPTQGKHIQGTGIIYILIDSIHYKLLPGHSNLGASHVKTLCLSGVGNGFCQSYTVSSLAIIYEN